nr:hypothetical protein Iba_chr11dCG10730 [Ipomoea batatas]
MKVRRLRSAMWPGAPLFPAIRGIKQEIVEPKKVVCEDSSKEMVTSPLYLGSGLKRMSSNDTHLSACDYNASESFAGRGGRKKGSAPPPTSVPQSTAVVNLLLSCSPVNREHKRIYLLLQSLNSFSFVVDFVYDDRHRFSPIASSEQGSSMTEKIVSTKSNNERATRAEDFTAFYFKI